MVNAYPRLPALAAAFTLASAGPAAAFEFDFGRVSYELNGNYVVGAALRTEDPDRALVALANGGQGYSTNNDDGTLAFIKGNLVGAVSTFSPSLKIAAGSVSLHLSGNYIYNPVLMGKDLFDSADYLPNVGKEFGLDELNRKQAEVRDAAGNDAMLQDAYLALSYEIFERPVTLRLGRQALAWSRSRLMTNGLQALTARDLNRLRVPGADSADGVVPANQAWLATDISDGVSLETFYQFEWEPTVLDAAGTFFSTNDYLGPGGTQFNLGFGRAGENADSSTVCVPPPPGGSSCVPFGSTIPRAASREPDDGGQYGLALRAPIPWLREAGLSVAYANFHSRLPVLSGISRLSSFAAVDTASYFTEYPEDVRIAGLGVDFPVDFLDSSVIVEYTRTLDQPLQIDDVELHLAMLGAPSQFSPVSGATLGQRYLQGWRRHDVSQASISLMRLFGPRLGFDALTVLMEVGGVAAHGLPPQSVLRYEGPGTHTPGDAAEAANRSLPQQREGYATGTSWGYRLLATVSFSDVLDLALLEPTVRFAHDVAGITPEPLGNFVEGRKEAGVSLDMTFGKSWTAQLGYTTYFGAGLQNLLADRDHVGAHLKFSF